MILFQRNIIMNDPVCNVHDGKMALLQG